MQALKEIIAYMESRKPDITDRKAIICLNRAILTIKSYCDEPDLPHGVEFKEVWSEWVAYRRGIRKPMTSHTQNLQLKSLSELSERQAIDCIKQSIFKGWTGLFPEQVTAKNNGMNYDQGF